MTESTNPWPSEIANVTLSKIDKEFDVAMNKLENSPSINNTKEESFSNVAITPQFALPPIKEIKENKESDFFINNSFDTIFNPVEVSSNLSVSENEFLRFKPLKYLYKAVNDKKLESKIFNKTVGNPFRVKFLHDFLVYLLLTRSEMMLMSCACDTNNWKQENIGSNGERQTKFEEYQKIRSLICSVHSKLKLSAWAGFRPNIFQDFRGFNFFSKDMIEHLLNIFNKI